MAPSAALVLEVTPVRTELDARRVAYHEAGHAVAAVFVGGGPELTWVSLEPTDESEGSCRFVRLGFRPDAASSDAETLKLDSYVVVCLAGAAAERRLLDDAGPGCADDVQAAYDLAGHRCGSSRQETAYLEWLTICTEDLLAVHWPAVEALAATLLAQPLLPGADARAIIEAAPWGTLPEDASSPE